MIKKIFAAVLLACVMGLLISSMDIAESKISVRHGNTDKQPLQTYIQSLSITLTTDQMANMTAEEKMQRMNVSSITFNSAKAIVSMIPVVAIYPFIQKFFVTGIVMGAVKE